MGKKRTLHRITPELPADFSPTIEQNEPIGREVARDKFSGWSFAIRYEGGSIESRRRITLRKIDADMSGVRALHTYCHEAQGPREFRMDRILEVIDLGTGEIMDSLEFAKRLLSPNSIITERRLTAMATVLVFIARCDGYHHALEWHQIQMSILRLCRSLMDQDWTADAQISQVKGLTPDYKDFKRAFRLLRQTRLPEKTLLEFRRAIGDVIEADEFQDHNEVYWALEAQNELTKLKPALTVDQRSSAIDISD